MHASITRRKFLFHTGITLLSAPFVGCSNTRKLGGIIPGMQLGYSAITWGGNDVQAIQDIASLGFKGIQLRSNILANYGSKPQEIRALLEQHQLALPMFSSGNANINTGNDEAVIQTHLNNAKFVKALGGENIQLTNSSRPAEGKPSVENLRKYGQLINEIGKRTLDIGVQSNYHNHMHQLGETPEEVDIILENADEKNVKLLLDIAHYYQGGGDPVKAITTHRQRLHALHLKDVRPNTGGGSRVYTFVELGQGKVDLPAVFKKLDDIKFKGWGIIELDAVPEKEKTPLQCGNITKTYLQAQGIKI